MTSLMTSLIALDLPGGPDFIDHLRRIWDDGDAVLPLDQRLPPVARAALLERLRPDAVIDRSGTRSRLSGAIPLEPDDAVVIATSGTTGDPKGVIHTHAALRASAEFTSSALLVDPDRDRWFACLPMAHIGGFATVSRALLTGTPITAVAEVTAENLSTALHTGHTLTSLVVAALDRTDPARWRTILLGGSALPPELPPSAVRTYGMTETGSGVVYDGFALHGVSVRSIDGELQLRTPSLARAYRVPEAGSAGVALDVVFGDDPADQGWFRTGDGGAVGPDGRVSVTGRLGDVIVTGAEKVWPEPVERVLAALPGIVDVAVCGRPDPTWGSSVTALVVPSDPATPPSLAEIRDAVKAVLAPYCAPTAVFVVDAIPRTALGKVQRTRLSSLFDSTP